MRAVGILLCAGSASRMGFDKLITPLCGKSAIERSLDALILGGVQAVVFAVSAETRAFVEALPCPVEKLVVAGGSTRQASVRAALEAAARLAGVAADRIESSNISAGSTIPSSNSSAENTNNRNTADSSIPSSNSSAGSTIPSSNSSAGSTINRNTADSSIPSSNISAGNIAVIHDAARCMVSPALVASCIESAVRTGSGIAAVPVSDTVFRQAGDDLSVVPREGLWRMQTPQAFRLAAILDAYRVADGAATDDATLFLNAGHVPALVLGSEDNFKLTAPSDWARAERMLARYGTGFDTHRLVEGRRLILGGVEIPFERGLLGHSDADVLAHAVTDALLGAAGLPDIGHLFPDSDPAYSGANSLLLLKTAVARIAERGLRVGQIDATIIAERPKMAPHIERMRQNLAAACGIGSDAVNVKATTTEGMNDEGRGLCISAQAVATVI